MCCVHAITRVLHHRNAHVADMQHRVTVLAAVARRTRPRRARPRHRFGGANRDECRNPGHPPRRILRCRAGRTRFRHIPCFTRLRLHPRRLWMPSKARSTDRARTSLSMVYAPVYASSAAFIVRSERVAHPFAPCPFQLERRCHASEHRSESRGRGVSEPPMIPNRIAGKLAMRRGSSRSALRPRYPCGQPS